MDVTCERCSTAYEFDDALVSERGTTVKCTNCGHQFKVRRPQPAGAPERWLVRTIDGRELEFRALRELQAAIAQALITRDDVLSRGGSRPRRLGSIAELEPFFVSAGAGGSHSTSMGLGPRAPITMGETPKPPAQPVITGLAQPPTPEPSRPRAPAGETPRPPQAAASQPVTAQPAYDRSRVATSQGIGVTPAPRSSEVSIAIPLPRGPDPEKDARAQAASPRRPGSIPPPPRRSTPPPPPAGLPGVIVAPSGAPPLPPAPGVPTIHDEYDDTTRAVPARPRGPVPPEPPKPAGPPRPPGRTIDDVSAPTAPFQIGAVLDPVKVRAAAREDWSPDARPDDAGEDPPQNQHTASVPPLTPTPAAVRHSYADDLVEPRFSQAAAPQGRAGAARWIAGVLLLGVLALAGATVGRTMLTKDAPAKPGPSDARIDTLLAGGEKSLGEGDLESAKEQFDKASVLAERDGRAAADLARLASAKADVEWLRVRLLDGDPEQANARRDLEEAAQRARKAADHAAELAPQDHGVVRSRIDALRLAGDVSGARKLVGGISAASAQPDNALTLAELDLAETKPDWPTVVGRLRAALSSDANLGRARSMLVYALAKSGDAAGARAELDRLGTLPRPHPHPLINALRAFITRSTASLDPNALPDASAKPAAGKPGAAAGPQGPSAQAPREPREPREPKERPAPAEPRPTPEEHVQPPSGPVDTSDLPGVKAPPTPAHTAAPATTAAPAPTSTLPPGVDTSDLPGFK